MRLVAALTSTPAARRLLDLFEVAFYGTEDKDEGRYLRALVRERNAGNRRRDRGPRRRH